MKFISRFLKKKAPPPTAAELEDRLETVKALLNRYSDIGRGALEFLEQNNVSVEMADLSPKKLGAYFKSSNKIIINYNTPPHKQVDILVHEAVHAAQKSQNKSFDLEKPYTPFKTMMLQRYSEAQSFVLGAVAAREVYEGMRKESADMAKNYIKGFKPDPIETAYANALSSDPNKPTQAMRAAFDAFFQNSKSEMHNYDQNIGYSCEMNLELWHETPRLEDPDVEALHLSDLTDYGNIPFGQFKDRNFLKETGTLSLTNKSYTTIRDSWVSQNIGNAERMQRLIISEKRNTSSDNIKMRDIATSIKCHPVKERPFSLKPNKSHMGPI